jgi:hypothetical protein
MIEEFYKSFKINKMKAKALWVKYEYGKNVAS